MNIQCVSVVGREKRKCLTCGRLIGTADGDPGEVEGLKENLSELAMICGDCLKHDFGKLQKLIYAAADRSSVGYKAAILRAYGSGLRVIPKVAEAVVEEDGNSRGEEVT